MAEVKENPTIEEPEVPATNSDDDAKSLLEELKAIGVEKPEQVQGMFTASQQTGKAWNEVGELRKEVDRLTKALEARQTNYEPDYSQDVDIATIVKSAVRDTYVNDILKPQQEAQMRVVREQQEVQGDEDYALVKDMFEKHISNPAIQANVYSGQSSLKDEYNKLVRTYYREVAKRSRNVLEKMTEKTTPKPPHVEAGDTRSVPLPSEDEETRARKKKIVDNRSSGVLDSDAALEALIAESLPKDDPIFQ